MAIKNHITLLALAGLIATASFGQKNDASYSWVLDSSKRSVKNMPQQNEFMNNTYPYPARPRDMWELGISGGVGYLLSDLKSKTGIAGGLSLRKSLGHTTSLRASWTGSFIKGEAAYGHGTDFKTTEHLLSLDALFTLNNPGYYRGDPKANIYLLGGYSLVLTQTEYKGFDGEYRVFHDVIQRHLITTLFKDAAPDRYNSKGSKSQWLMHGFDLGGGIALKTSDRVNLGIEQKFVYLPTDQLDAYNGGTWNDILSYTTLRLNYNLGNSSKKVQPLWWLNPNNYVYNEVNTPKHMKIPTPVLPDADGDGVTDQFDMEPNTPSGCPVDSHGVSRDTDGDGVPDCKDKEPLTARDCFPVDADGIGKCPEPPCCAELRDSLKNLTTKTCNISSLPSVQFRSGSLTLSSTAKAVLNNVAQQLNANPNCNVRVNGYYQASSKRSQQLSWDRVNTVIKYLSEQQGISEGRLIWNLSAGGDPNTVDFMGTTETGPNTIPAPFPNLQRSK
jgi:outer membrane protein OmpA-like peptidoglycan-associated protein